MRPPLGPISSCAQAQRFSKTSPGRAPSLVQQQVYQSHGATTVSEQSEGNAISMAACGMVLAAWPSGWTQTHSAETAMAILAAAFGDTRRSFRSPQSNFRSRGVNSAGRAWGGVPQYARFCGGNHAQNFLTKPMIRRLSQPFPLARYCAVSAAGGPQRATVRKREAALILNLNLNAAFLFPNGQPLYPPFLELPKEISWHAVLTQSRTRSWKIA
jgi:hypothetical protein